MFEYLIALKVPLDYFYFMISNLIVIWKHTNYKAFARVNIGKVLKCIYSQLICLFVYLLADDVILLAKLVPDFHCT